MRMRSHRDIIQLFGGTSALARHIAITPMRANHFPARGIPAVYWLDVERAARKLGVPITAQVLKDLAPPRKTTRRN